MKRFHLLERRVNCYPQYRIDATRAVRYVPRNEFSLAFRYYSRLSQRQDKVYDRLLLFFISWDDISDKTSSTYSFGAVDYLFTLASMFINFYPVKHYLPSEILMRKRSNKDLCPSYPGRQWKQMFTFKGIKFDMKSLAAYLRFHQNGKLGRFSRRRILVPRGRDPFGQH